METNTGWSGMNKYNVIADEQILRDFIDWLPDLNEDEIYYVCLFSRKKYDVIERPGVSRDKDQLKRFTAQKKDLYKKIKQLELEYGAYTHKDGSPVPQESLVIYMTLNPRSQTKAAKSLLIELANKVTQKYDNYNVHQLAMPNIHKAKSRTCWVDFDFDYNSCETEWLEMESKIEQPSFTKEIPSKLRYELYVKGMAYSYLTEDYGIDKPSDHIVKFLRTRGGLHVLVNPENVPEKLKKSFYKNMTSILGCDQSGDNMIPIPGCYQGMFIPEFVR
jgi:hypothetical protein